MSRLGRHKVLPVAESGVVDRVRHRHRLGLGGLAAKLQASLLRGLVTLEAVDPLVAEHEVVPRGPTTTRTRDDVVEVALTRAELLAGVLTHTAVTLVDVLARETRAAQ